LAHIQYTAGNSQLGQLFWATLYTVMSVCVFVIVVIQSSAVVDLMEENYEEILKTRFVFVNFYKPW